MTRSTKISFICFALVLSLELLIAVRFLSATRIMDYHQVAMGVPWDNLPAGMQTMTLNFMRAAGLGFLLAGVAISFILAFPFRQGQPWARWALLSIGLTQAMVMGLIVFSVRTHTPSVPPIGPFILSAVLSIIGFQTYGGLKPHVSGDEK